MTEPNLTSIAGMTYACSDPEGMVKLLIGQLHWKILCEGAVDRTLENLWGISPGSAGNHYTVVRSPRSDRGMIRVVAGDNRKRTTPMSTRWSGVELVVMEDIQVFFKRLEDHPDWTIGRPPKTIDFTDAGANIHTYFYAYPPGGTHFIFAKAETQARDYPFPSSPNPIGQIFDLHLDVDRTGPSRKFYEDILGLITVFDEDMTEGLFYETWDISQNSPANLSILKGYAPENGLDGIEMRSFEAAEMDPLPAKSDKFDGGCCMGTYCAKDIDDVFEAVSGHSLAEVLSEPRGVDAPPYNGNRAFCFLGPSCERLEIYEGMWG